MKRISGQFWLALLIQKRESSVGVHGHVHQAVHRFAVCDTGGHRVNHVARTRATARRTVMKESRKCRSGRVAVRTVR